MLTIYAQGVCYDGKRACARYRVGDNPAVAVVLPHHTQNQADYEAAIMALEAAKGQADEVTVFLSNTTLLGHLAGRRCPPSLQGYLWALRRSARAFKCVDFAWRTTEQIEEALR